MMLTLMLGVALLAGCGKSGTTADDAKAYVQAMLDVMCTGDYDHSVELVDVEEGNETAIRDDVVAEIVESVSQSAGLDEDVKASFNEVILTAFSKAKYTVGDATETGDNEYDVTVSIEPLKLFNLDSGAFESAVTAKVQENAEAVSAMSEAEQVNFVMKIMIDHMRTSLEDPQYDEPVEVVVHYGPIDDNGTYGCSKEDGEALGAKLFSTEGM